MERDVQGAVAPRDPTLITFPAHALLILEERKDTPQGMKPKFSDGSFCWWVWLIFTGFTWCF
jgi:hypothetical protein